LVTGFRNGDDDALEHCVLGLDALGPSHQYVHGQMLTPGYDRGFAIVENGQRVLKCGGIAEPLTTRFLKRVLRGVRDGECNDLGDQMNREDLYALSQHLDRVMGVIAAKKFMCAVCDSIEEGAQSRYLLRFGRDTTPVYTLDRDLTVLGREGEEPCPERIGGTRVLLAACEVEVNGDNDLSSTDHNFPENVVVERYSNLQKRGMSLTEELVVNAGSRRCIAGMPLAVLARARLLPQTHVNPVTGYGSLPTDRSHQIAECSDDCLLSPATDGDKAVCEYSNAGERFAQSDRSGVLIPSKLRVTPKFSDLTTLDAEITNAASECIGVFDRYTEAGRPAYQGDFSLFASAATALNTRQIDPSGDHASDSDTDLETNKRGAFKKFHECTNNQIAFHFFVRKDASASTADLLRAPEERDAWSYDSMLASERPYDTDARFGGDPGTLEDEWLSAVKITHSIMGTRDLANRFEERKRRGARDWPAMMRDPQNAAQVFQFQSFTEDNSRTRVSGPPEDHPGFFYFASEDVPLVFSNFRLVNGTGLQHHVDADGASYWQRKLRTAAHANTTCFVYSQECTKPAPNDTEFDGNANDRRGARDEHHYLRQYSEYWPMIHDHGDAADDLRANGDDEHSCVYVEYNEGERRLTHVRFDTSNEDHKQAAISNEMLAWGDDSQNFLRMCARVQHVPAPATELAYYNYVFSRTSITTNRFREYVQPLPEAAIEVIDSVQAANYGVAEPDEAVAMPVVPRGSESPAPSRPGMQQVSRRPRALLARLNLNTVRTAPRLPVASQAKIDEVHTETINSIVEQWDLFAKREGAWGASLLLDKETYEGAKADGLKIYHGPTKNTIQSMSDLFSRHSPADLGSLKHMCDEVHDGWQVADGVEGWTFVDEATWKAVVSDFSVRFNAENHVRQQANYVYKNAANLSTDMTFSNIMCPVMHAAFALSRSAVTHRTPNMYEDLSALYLLAAHINDKDDSDERLSGLATMACEALNQLFLRVYIYAKNNVETAKEFDAAAGSRGHYRPKDQQAVMEEEYLCNVFVQTYWQAIRASYMCDKFIDVLGKGRYAWNVPQFARLKDFNIPRQEAHAVSDDSDET